MRGKARHQTAKNHRLKVLKLWGKKICDNSHNQEDTFQLELIELHAFCESKIW